jgi:hypothetical protein
MKHLKSCLCLLVSLSSLGIANAANFNDVPSNYWAGRYINYLAEKNIIGGYPDGSFRPNQPVTRAEFSAMLAKSQSLTSTSISSFTDIPEGHWAAGAISAVASKGWIAGYPGNQFLPNQSISQADMYAIITKASGLSKLNENEINKVFDNYDDAQEVPNWARSPVATVLKAGYKADELNQASISPTVQASRTAVVSSLAKLLNSSFRIAQKNTTPAESPVELGESINVEGSLRPTSTVGGWILAADSGKEYSLTNLGNLPQQSWFNMGRRVQLKGNIDSKLSTNTRQTVRVQSLTNLDEGQGSTVRISGTLQPSTQTSGDWLVKTDNGTSYRILNPEKYTNASWFRYGTTVAVNGNLRPDIKSTEGASILTSNIESTNTQKTISVSGTLKPTTEGGGWYLQSTVGNYVLIDSESVRDREWFKSGTVVDVQGNLRPDIASIYTEGPILSMTTMSPNLNSLVGQQTVNLYYPNLLNIISNSATLVGQPVQRIIEGPNVQRKLLEALLQGPTSSEQLKGYFQDKDIQQVSIETFEVSNAVATVKLRTPDNLTLKTSTQQQLQDQIEKTLEQFTDIQKVNVIFDHKTLSAQ